MSARLDYWTDATYYGCASTNDGYRVMDKMAERVPGVNDTESRSLSADDALGNSGRHIEISFADPDLVGFIDKHSEFFVVMGNFSALVNSISQSTTAESGTDAEHMLKTGFVSAFAISILVYAFIYKFRATPPIAPVRTGIRELLVDGLTDATCWMFKEWRSEGIKQITLKNTCGRSRNYSDFVRTLTPCHRESARRC